MKEITNSDGSNPDSDLQKDSDLGFLQNPDSDSDSLLEKYGGRGLGLVYNNKGLRLGHKSTKAGILSIYPSKNLPNYFFAVLLF